MNTDDLKTRILGINDFSSSGEVASVRNDVAALNAIGREMKRDADAATLDWMQVNGDLVSGNMKWYAGVERDYETPDPAKTLEALFISLAGDFEKVAACLSSSAFKVGTCREVLANAFDLHFVETVKPDVKTSKAKRVVKVTNLDFAGKASDE